MLGVVLTQELHIILAILHNPLHFKPCHERVVCRMAGEFHKGHWGKCGGTVVEYAWLVAMAAAAGPWQPPSTTTVNILWLPIENYRSSSYFLQYSKHCIDCFNEKVMKGDLIETATQPEGSKRPWQLPIQKPVWNTYLNWECANFHTLRSEGFMTTSERWISASGQQSSDWTMDFFRLGVTQGAKIQDLAWWM